MTKLGKTMIKKIIILKIVVADKAAHSLDLLKYLLSQGLEVTSIFFKDLAQSSVLFEVMYDENLKIFSQDYSRIV